MNFCLVDDKWSTHPNIKDNDNSMLIEARCDDNTRRSC